MANKATIPGLSTLGVVFSYGVETTAGTKPTTFKKLERCSEIAGITLETEAIDVSTLEDLATRSVPGRQDNGGTWEVTFNLTDDTISQLEEMMEESNTAYSSGKQTWFQISHPNMAKSFFVIAQPGSQIPLPDFAQNEAMTGAISLVISEYKGLDTKVEPTEQGEA